MSPREKSPLSARSGYRCGSVQGLFTLPQEIASDKNRANYNNGVLELRLPKSEEAKATRFALSRSHFSPAIQVDPDWWFNVR